MKNKNKNKPIIPMLEGKVGRYLIPRECLGVKEALKKYIKLKGAF